MFISNNSHQNIRQNYLQIFNPNLLIENKSVHMMLTRNVCHNDSCHIYLNQTKWSINPSEMSVNMKHEILRSDLAVPAMVKHALYSVAMSISR